jgi:hypothetical protein
MAQSDGRRVEMLGIQESGVSSRMAADGLRIALAKDLWVAIDLRWPSGSALETSIGWHTTRDLTTEIATMAILPSAGNVIAVEVSTEMSTSAKGLTVYPVEVAHERQRSPELSSETSCGDPIGKEIVSEAVAAPTDLRRFRVEWPGGGNLRLQILPSKKYGVRVELWLTPGHLGRTGTPASILSMLLKPHAANLISVLMRETRAAMVEQL